MKKPAYFHEFLKHRQKCWCFQRVINFTSSQILQYTNSMCHLPPCTFTLLRLVLWSLLQVKNVLICNFATHCSYFYSLFFVFTMWICKLLDNIANYFLTHLMLIKLYIVDCMRQSDDTVALVTLIICSPFYAFKIVCLNTFFFFNIVKP